MLRPTRKSAKAIIEAPMRAAVVVLSLAVCGSAGASQQDITRARTALAIVAVAPTLCKTLRAAPSATSAILSKISAEESAEILSNKGYLEHIQKGVRDIMASGDEANACQMARDFERKLGIQLFETK